MLLLLSLSSPSSSSLLPLLLLILLLLLSLLSLFHKYYFQGLVNAHTGDVEDTWDDLPHSSKVRAVFGNKKTGASYGDIVVEKSGNTCKHRDSVRRIEVGP